MLNSCLRIRVYLCYGCCVAVQNEEEENKEDEAVQARLQKLQT